MGSSAGAVKIAARKIGISPEAYQRHLDAGELWCCGCRAFHAANEFAINANRSTGRDERCRKARSAQSAAYRQRRRQRSEAAA